MPSDYKKICRNNIRRRGEEFDDIGRLISEQLYSDRSHFVYELLHNAEDALERRFRQHPNNSSCYKVQFRLFQDRLEFRHFGVPFNEGDVKGISDVLKGTKEEDLSQIGKFGIGFKSVYAFTASPEIHSGDEHFVIKRYIRPEERYPKSDLEIAPGETVFIFPFDHEDLSENRAFDLILDKLRGLGPRVLLFLRRIDEIEWSVQPEKKKGHYLKEAEQVNNCKAAHRVTVIGEKNGQVEEENWLIFKRPVSDPDGRNLEVCVEAGFRLETSTADRMERIVRENNTPLVVYFPTEKDTKLGFLIQGPYRTTTARDNILGDDDWNKQLINETAELAVESLRLLKKMDLLSVSLLEALPIRTDDFLENSIFYPIFEEVSEALMDEELLPANDGSFVAGRNAKLARGAGLMKILNQDQLCALFESLEEIKWLSADISQDRTPDLRSYLIDVFRVEEIAPETFARRLSEQFLAAQSDEWFIEFYEFLSDQKALWRPRRWQYDTEGILRSKPILRLQDGSHVNPFQNDDSPNGYLTDGTDTETSLPIMKVELSLDQKVQEFLNELGIPELDLVAEVIEEILPKYMDDSRTVESKKNERDLIKIERAYKTDSQDKKGRLRDALLKTPFILAEHPSLGRMYRKPEQVYFGSDELCNYFSGNNCFAYINLDHPQYELFKDLGVRETVRVRRKEASDQGHVVIEDSHGRHKRGLAGFDLDIKVDGLKYAISNPNLRKSAFIWNKIAVPNLYCIRGIMESSTRRTYQDSGKEDQISEFGKLLTDTTWLPDSDGDMHKPGVLALDDLPESFVRNEKLANQLGMKKNVVAKLREEAGVSEESLEYARQIERMPPETRQKNSFLTSRGERGTTPVPSKKFR